MQIEADGLLSLAKNKETKTIAKMNFTKCTLFDKEVVIVICGCGKVNAAMCTLALIHNYNPEVIINSGVAGSLSERVSIGDIVVATKSVEHDMNTTALGDKQGEVSFPDGMIMYFDCDEKTTNLLADVCRNIPDTRVETGIIASGDMFVSERKKRLLIKERFDALACEMEGAAIGHVCNRCDVPYTILRAISDDLDENKGMDFVKFCELASRKTVTAICEFIKQV